MSEQFIVSGSNGFLGKKVVSLLSDRGKQVIGLYRGMKPQEDGNVRYISNDVFLAEPEEYMCEETVFIHLAFARANRGSRGLAESLDFMENILNNVGPFDNLKNFIYISSQGIYGKSEEIRQVMNKAEPATPYSMAKYAAEKMVEVAFKNKDYCILRLDNVIQSQNFVKALSESAISRGRIDITGGKQIFSYIDGDDAAEAIAVCACGGKSKEHIYNVGPNRMRVSLLEVAEIVKQVAAKYNNNVEVAYTPDETVLWAGMDTGAFCMAYHWEPKYNMFQMVERVYGEVLGIKMKDI